MSDLYGPIIDALAHEGHEAKYDHDVECLRLRYGWLDIHDDQILLYDDAHTPRRMQNLRPRRPHIPRSPIRPHRPTPPMTTVIATKTCSKCSTEKPIENFPQFKRKSGSIGRSSWCNACKNVCSPRSQQTPPPPTRPSNDHHPNQNPKSKPSKP